MLNLLIGFTQAAGALTCNTLPSNNVCGTAYAGYPVETTLDQFSSGIQGSFMSKSNMTQTFINLGKCDPNQISAAVDTLRFQASFACSSYIGQFISDGCAVSPGLVSSGPALCASNCFMAVQTFSNLVKNATLCPNGGIFQAQINKMNAYCTSVQAQGSNCVAGSSPESSVCGYIDESTAVAQCTGSQDACCVSFLKNRGSSGNSTLIIAIAVVIGVVLIVALFGSIYYFKRRKPVEVESQKYGNEPYQAPMDYGYKQEPAPISAPIHTPNPSSAPTYAPEPAPIPVTPIISSAEVMDETPRVTVPVSVIQPIPAPQETPATPTLLSLPDDAKKYNIIHPYNSVLDDELSLVEGKAVYLLKAFDDGWGLAVDPETGKQGAVPLVCVEEATEDVAIQIEKSRDSEVRISKRLSSMPEETSKRAKVPFSMYMAELEAQEK
ncbi:hypothetical protein HDV06_006510 [Boothiomyces sp. JEL0866]|nr:hypothetical protein HDV06_006510 [Boothiomyces sp. JEL0866]